MYGTCLHFGTDFQAFSDPPNLPAHVAQQAKMTSYTANRYIYETVDGKPETRDRDVGKPQSPKRKTLFAKPQTLKGARRRDGLASLTLCL